MPKLRTLVLLVLAVAIPACALAKETAACKLQRYGEVELEVGDGGVTLPAQVNGKPVRLALNLGSAFSAFWDDAANDLALKRVTPPFSADISFDDAPVRQRAVFDSLSIGSLPMGDGSFYVTTPRVPPTKGVVGFVGMNVFHRVDFELDLANRKLILFSQDHCRGAAEYRFTDNAAMPLLRGQSGEWYVPIDLEGHKIAATFSPGDPVTTLSRDVALRLYGFDENSPGVFVARDETRGTSYHYKAMQFTAPGIKVLNPTIALVPGIKNCGLDIRKRGVTRYGLCGDAYPAYIGLDILLKLRLYFATKERMLYFAAAEGVR